MLVRVTVGKLKYVIVHVTDILSVMACWLAIEKVQCLVNNQYIHLSETASLKPNCRPSLTCNTTYVSIVMLIIKLH